MVEKNTRSKQKDPELAASLGANLAASLKGMADGDRRVLLRAAADAIEEWEDFNKAECNSTYYLDFYFRNAAGLFSEEVKVKPKAA